MARDIDRAADRDGGKRDEHERRVPMPVIVAPPSIWIDAAPITHALVIDGSQSAPVSVWICCACENSFASVSGWSKQND